MSTSETSTHPWKRAVAWVIPILLWGGWLAASLHAVTTASTAIGSAEIAIGQDLSACQDFAKKDFMTPDPERAAECQRMADEAMAKLPEEQHGRTVTLRLAEGSAALAIVAALVYLFRVPRRLRAGVRGVMLAVIIAVLLGGAWLLLTLSGMPHLG